MLFLKKFLHYVKYRMRLEWKPIQKTYERWVAKGYNPAPSVSFIIQCHNRSASVSELVLQLRSIKTAEIIVIDDGSELKHTTRLAHLLTGANEFLIRANDLYEIISYDRAIYFSRGEYVVLLQDDDGFADLDWIDDAIKLFMMHAKLAILGGHYAISLEKADVSDDGIPGAWTYHGSGFSQVNICKGIHTAVPGREHSFRFVQTVNRAPMLLKRSHFDSVLRHIDQSFAPIQWDDAELCLRAWLAGLQVGWYEVNFQSGKYGIGGTRIWNNQLLERQNIVNAQKLYERYSNNFEEIRRLVELANADLESTEPTAQ